MYLISVAGYGSGMIFVYGGSLGLHVNVPDRIYHD